MTSQFLYSLPKYDRHDGTTAMGTTGFVGNWIKTLKRFPHFSKWMLADIQNYKSHRIFKRIKRMIYLPSFRIFDNSSVMKSQTHHTHENCEPHSSKYSTEFVVQDFINYTLSFSQTHEQSVLSDISSISAKGRQNCQWHHIRIREERISWDRSTKYQRLTCQRSMLWQKSYKTASFIAFS